MNGVRKLLGTPVAFSPKQGPSWPPSSPTTESAPPVATTTTGFSSPTSPPRGTPTSRSTSIRKSKRLSAPVNTRDELLLSLMASEAVIDSRDFEILSAEQVEDLKKEHQLLSERQVALSRKLGLETKIRDAALSLFRVNANSKRPSQQQPSEQLEAANLRVDNVQAELDAVSNNVSEIHSKLMEHRAAVLSFSVRSMESKLSGPPADDPGYDSSNRSTLTSPATNFSVLSSPSTSKFDGAHFFAGHADSVVPRRKLSPEAAATEILRLQTKLTEAKDALKAAGQKQAEMSRELTMIKLEKQEIETMAAFDKEQQCDERDAELKRLRREKEEWDRRRAENEMQTEGWNKQKEEWNKEKEGWKREKESWNRQHDQWNRENEERTREREVQNKEKEERIKEKEALVRQKEESTRTVRELETLRETIANLEAKNEHELRVHEEETDAIRRAWEDERQVWEDEKMEDLASLQAEFDARGNHQTNEELEAGLVIVQSIVKKHGVVLFARDNSLQGLLNGLGTHLDSVHTKLQSYAKAEADWDVVRRRLEDDVRSGFDKRESLARELDDVRRERDTIRAQSPPQIPNALIAESVSSSEATRVLQPIWAVLPSPEARAAKFGASARSYRTNSPTPGTPGGPNSNLSTTSGVITSLSDLDVRSLKALYDTRNNSNTPSSSPSTAFPSQALQPFTLEAFAARVQALIADDRALIERLLRFAQAHDLLKKNAERAQKLAQDGTHALETYQKQVRTLEERNMSMGGRIVGMQEELQLLHDSIERLTNDKRDLERRAAEQAETCRQLQEANDTLSTRALALAEEAAQAPAMVRAQLSSQIAGHDAEVAKLNARIMELDKQLTAAQDEVEAMRTSEQSQRIALLDELNSMQTENANLRAQLRATNRK